jgi:hypothetical protein
VSEIEGDDHSATGRCRSCDTPLHGRYCSACGESHKHNRLELRVLAEDALEGLVNLDTRALRTIGDLTVAPVQVCRDYLDGRRIQYVNPFKYALATFAFVFLVAELLSHLHGQPADANLAALMAFQLRWGQWLNFVAMPLLALLMLPLFMTAPRRLRWIEHYVLVLFAFGHVALLQGLFKPLLGEFGAAGQVLVAVLPLAYLSWIATGICGASWWTTTLRVLVAFVVMQLVVAGAVWLVVPELFAAG